MVHACAQESGSLCGVTSFAWTCTHSTHLSLEVSSHLTCKVCAIDDINCYLLAKRLGPWGGQVLAGTWWG